jgi:hypothetical protein
MPADLNPNDRAVLRLLTEVQEKGVFRMRVGSEREKWAIKNAWQSFRRRNPEMVGDGLTISVSKDPIGGFNLEFTPAKAAALINSALKTPSPKVQPVDLDAILDRAILEVRGEGGGQDKV